MKGLFEQGILAPGMDRFTKKRPFVARGPERAHRGVRKLRPHHPQLTLRDTVSAQANALPPGPGEVGALEEELRSLLERKYAVAVLAGTRRAAEALARDLQRDGFSATALTGPATTRPRHRGGAGRPPQRRGGLSLRPAGGVHRPAARPAARQKGKGQKQGPVQPDGHSARDYVVHQNHGIGLYAGIQRLDLRGGQGLFEDPLRKGRHPVACPSPSWTCSAGTSAPATATG